ncbi:hypothetical protein AAFN46_05445 [Pseudomonas sp. CAU 1711]|uniref:hypothetical protein n=1 Tax=Pseudomonas sp. CAU 1711 TaxID=3140356 RepID=UPI00326109C9
MSNFLTRNTLLGGFVMLSLLGAMHASASTAGEGHDEHGRHAAEAPKAAGDGAAPLSPDGAAQPRPMDHDAMSHEGMDHAHMTKGHGGEAEAGSNHDH